MSYGPLRSDAIEALFDAKLRGLNQFRTARAADPYGLSLVLHECIAPTHHWHLCSDGLSDVGEVSTDSSDLAGFGFELTMRVRSAQPPKWAGNVVRHLAYHVLQTGNPFGLHHVADLPTEGLRSLGSRLSAVVFDVDETLGGIETANGRVTFLEAVLVTDDEAELIRRWSCARFLKMIRGTRWRAAIELDRESMLEDPTLGPAMRNAMETEGSAAELEYMSPLRIQFPNALGMTLDADEAAVFVRALEGRTRHGRAFSIHTSREGSQGEELRIDIIPVEGSVGHWVRRPGNPADQEPETLVLAVPRARSIETAKQMSQRSRTVALESVPGVELVMT